MASFVSNVSITKKIFSIVVLLIALAAAVSIVGLQTLKRYDAEIAEMENATSRSLVGEQLNALVLSVVADSRGIYMSLSAEEANKYAKPLLATLAKIQTKVIELQTLLPAARKGELAELLAKSDEFVAFRTELARLSQEATLAEARAFGDNDANRNNRKKLNELIVATAAANAQEVEINRERIEELKASARQLIVLLVGIGSLVALVAAWALATFGIIRPLKAIQAAMNELAAGNNDVVIPGETRRDEVGQMAGAVGVFKTNAIEKTAMDKAQEKERQAKEVRQKRVDALLEKFDANTRQVVASVSSASTELSVTAEHMNDTARATSEKSNEVSSASTETSTNVQSVASAAEELSATVQEIASQLSKSMQVIKDATVKVETADQSANELVKASQSIGNITAMIEDITSQINLLALNAAIESARAGEAGKGFAVVASEVKTLAAQATNATEQIRSQLSNVLAMSQTVAAELQQVKGSVNAINEYSSGIASAVEEQSAATNEIVRNMQIASSGVEKINQNIDSIRSAAENGQDTAQQVVDAAKILSQDSEMLDKQVRSFLQDIQAA